MRKKLRSVPAGKANKTSRDPLAFKTKRYIPNDPAWAYLDYTVGSDGCVATFRFRGKWQKAGVLQGPRVARRGRARRSNTR
jgi:hypothetical protein